MDTLDLVNAAIAGDRDAVLAAFSTSMADKVTDALEIKKVEIASNLLDIETEETTDGSTEVQAEVDGSDASAEAVTDAE
jgi:hypothetical protein